MRSGALSAGAAGMSYSTTFREQLCTFRSKELRTLKAMTEGNDLAGDTTSNQATTLRRIPEVRVGELVAERVQVGDVGSKFTDGVSKSLRKQGLAEAEGEDRGAFSSRWVKFAGRCRLVTEGRDNEAPVVCWSLLISTEMRRVTRMKQPDDFGEA
eukprot:6180093-Pleurochrysis_carterae.AAC.2